MLSLLFHLCAFRRQTPRMCVHLQYDFFPNESRLIDLRTLYIYLGIIFFHTISRRYTRQQQSSSYIHNIIPPIRFIYFFLSIRIVNNTTICSYRCSEFNNNNIMLFDYSPFKLHSIRVYAAGLHKKLIRSMIH